MTHSNELLKDARVIAALADLSSLVQWLNQKYTAIRIEGDTRASIATGCLDVALEHQMGIEALARFGLYGSMLALLRVLFEALIRGIWIARCATDTEVEYFRTNDKIKDDKSFETLVIETEAGIGNTTKTLLKVKQQSWKELNSFTHTGMLQIARRHGDGTLGPNYSVEDVVRALNGAGVLGLLAAIEMATIAGIEALAIETLERSREYPKKPGNRQ